MSAPDRFFIFFCLHPGCKAVLAALLAGCAALAGSWYALLSLLLLLPMELRGLHLIRVTHPSLKEDLEEELVSACQDACGIHPGEHHYVFQDSSGSVGHRLLHRLPDTLAVTVLAPKRDYAVMARREGRIFPPKTYLPPAFDTNDLGCVEIYYRDIHLVEMENGTLRLHTLAGGEHEIPAGGGEAAEAALYLRQRLRDFKSRTGDVL